MIRSEKGFTLIELVLVITILGILAVAALPNFINVSTEAKQSSMAGVVGAVRAGINLYRANDLVKNGPPGIYPTTGAGTPAIATTDDLDNAAATVASTATPFFTNVLQQGVSDSAWVKGAALGDYVYTISAGVTCTYTYNNATGTFTGVAAGGATCP